MEASEALRDMLAKPERTPRNLYVIGDELEEIGELIATNGGEITPDIEARLDALDGEWSAKVERIALFIRQLELEAENAEVEEKRLKAIKQARTNKARGLRNWLLGGMERAGRDKVQTYRVRVLRYQGQGFYRWRGDTYEQIPERFRKTNPVVYSLDTEAVKQAVAAGEQLPPEIVLERDWHVRIS